MCVNVRLISTRTKFKKGSFYCPFFMSERKSLVMNKVMNV